MKVGNHSKGGTREQRIQARHSRLIDKIASLEDEIASLKKTRLSNNLELERLRDEKRGGGLGWERDAEGRDSLQLTEKQNKTMASIFSPAEWVWVDRSNKGFAQVVLRGDDSCPIENAEKAIAKINKVNWKDLMQLKKEGLAKNIFDDDEALFISVPLEIARVFHDVEGDE